MEKQEKGKREKIVDEKDSSTEVRDDDSDVEKEMFLSVRFQKLLVSPRNISTIKLTLSGPSVSEKDLLRKIIPKKRKKQPLLRRSKLGESLTRLHKCSDLTETIEATCSLEKKTIFGRQFSSSLDNFAGLTIGDKGEENAKKKGEEIQFETESFRTINGCGAGKRKRATSPPEEVVRSNNPPASCGQQARLTQSDVTADELAGYLEDTAFFPKRMSYMAEMMYT